MSIPEFSPVPPDGTNRDSRPTNVRWVIFGLASLASYINYVHRYSWGVIKPYLLEDGVITAPLKGVNLIGNGPDVLRKVDMLGNDYEVSDGIWTCGKEGQSVPVGVGTPSVRISAITVGGTEA